MQGAPHTPQPSATDPHLPATSAPQPQRVPARSRGAPTHQRSERRGACQRLGLRAAPGCRSRSPAKRPAGAAGTRQGRCSAGVGTGRWRHRRGAGTRCAAGGIRANPALTWVWGRRAAGGGGGIPSAMPPASPAPSPGSAAAREKGDRVFGKGGELGWAGVSGLSGIQPPPPARSRASAPPPPKPSPEPSEASASRAERRGTGPGTAGPAPAASAEAWGRRGSSVPVTTATEMAPLPPSPCGCTFRPWPLDCSVPLGQPLSLPEPGLLL